MLLLKMLIKLPVMPKPPTKKQVIKLKLQSMKPPLKETLPSKRKVIKPTKRLPMLPHLLKKLLIKPTKLLIKPEIRPKRNESEASIEF